MIKPDIRIFTQYLLEGNDQEAWNYLLRYKDKKSTEIFHELITPAMQHVGELWEQNIISVAEEHIATAVCDFILSRLFLGEKKEDIHTPNKAMFLCVQGEQHYIGLKMAHFVFQEKGWDTLYFGPNLPLEYAVQKAESWQPDIIGLSVSIVYHLPQIKTYINELSNLQNKPTILLGGRVAEKVNLSDCVQQPIIINDMNKLEQMLDQYWVEKDKKILPY